MSNHKQVARRSREARLMRLIALAGVGLGRAIYGRPTIGATTHKGKRLADLVHAYAEEHARVALEHAKEMTR